MLYIELFHGRKYLDDLQDDWGFEGPVFGPYDYVHTTYANEIKMCREGRPHVLTVVDDFVYYDGAWFGDWSVFDEASVVSRVITESGRDASQVEAKIENLFIKRLCEFDQALARPPVDVTKPPMDVTKPPEAKPSHTPKVMPYETGVPEVFFTITDSSADSPNSLVVRVREEAGQLLIKPDGYGTFASAEGFGVPILLDLYEGRLRLLAWDDINKEDPVVVNIQGACESAK